MKPSQLQRVLIFCTLFLFSASTTVLCCVPAPSGLMGWWPAEGDANDSIGGNNGTLINGASFTNGMVGQAFSLDGTSYVSIPDSPALDIFVSSITIETWIKVNQLGANSDWAGIVTKGNSSWRLQGTAEANTITFSASGVSPNGDLYGSQNVNDGQWHHVAAVYDGTNMFLYVDGTLDVSQPATGSISQNSYPICIGENAEAWGHLWNGLIDEVSVYDRALTAAEIQSIYSAGTSGKCPVPPTIIVSPTNQTIFVGDTANFGVTASGTSPLSYQWQFDGTNIDGATNSILSLTNAQPSDAGFYSVTVTNLLGSMTSSNAVLTLLAIPPTIVFQPTNQTVYVGGTANFRVMVTGAKPLSYRWNDNGTNIEGATNTTLTLTNVQLSQAGNYAVTVTNVYGATNSAEAVLTVNPLPPCAPASSGTVSWWPGEGNADDVAGANNGTLVGGVSFAPGVVGQAFSFDGSSGYVTIPDSASLDIFVSSLTIEAWIKVNQLGANSDWVGIVTKGNSSWRLQGTAGADTVTFSVSGVSPSGDLTGSWNVNDGQWHHVAGVYDGTNMFLYVDGELDVTQPATGTIAQNSYPMCIGENAEAPGHLWNGLIDEVSIYNRALTASEIQTIYAVGSEGKCPLTLPVIISQPTSQTVCVGFTADFSVMATGAQPLSYQWNYNGTNIDGATNTSLTLTDVQLSQAGNYAVTVTNLYGSVLSSNGILTVILPPTYFVSLDSTNPVAPYLSWDTAATNIQDAVDAAIAGGTVLVSNGVYQTGGWVVYGSLTNRVAVIKPLTVQSVNGPAVTMIQGYPEIGDNAVRCVYLTNGAMLIGFTLTNGATRNDGDINQEQSGSGIWCESTNSLVTNCVLNGNSATLFGGGTYQGSLNNCTLFANSAGTSGGGAYGATLNNCALSGNFGRDFGSSGGGAESCALNNCTLSGSYAHNYGGGADACVLNNCQITNNSIIWGVGGGVYASTLNDCLIVNNSANAGGGAESSTLNNCTLVGNNCNEGEGGYGGGAAYCALNNCILYYNNGNNDNFDNSDLSYCCTTPLPTVGVGNIADEPLFVDLINSDFHLQTNSPCINSGDNTTVAGSTDLDGNARIKGGTVDIGAYEYQTPTSIISYAWLQQYGLTNNGTADYADGDGDGFNNWNEWRAGTDPTDSSSLLKMTAVTNDVSGITVTWQSVNTRTYYLQRGTDLGVQPPFFTIQTDIAGQAGTTSYTDTTATNSGPYFYRVGVQ